MMVLLLVMQSLPDAIVIKTMAFNLMGIKKISCINNNGVMHE